MKNCWTSGTLMSVSSAYWRGCTLQAAVRLDLFTLIGDRELPPADLAEKLHSDPRATETLLNALCAMNLLEKNGRLFRNTPDAFKLLCKDSKEYIGHIILHHHHLLDGWRQLDNAIRSGSPVQKKSYGEELERESFLMGMFNLAMGTAPLIVKSVSLSGARCLLDLGGGPGTFAIHFCQANPMLRAVVFDRPTTERFMRRTVASFGLSNRITFRSGDFNHDAISGGPYDAAWLSHILHSNGPRQCQDLLIKTYGTMEKGGRVLIHDFILNDTKDGPEFAALFGLNMLINNSEGRTYSESEIASMLEAAGFEDIVLIDPQTPNNSKIIAARK